MSERLPKVLLIDDERDSFVIVRGVLGGMQRRAFDLEWAATYEAGRAALLAQSHDVYLLDYRLGAHDGLQLLHEAFASGCRKPIIMLTAQGDGELDMSALKAGAADYLVKGEFDAEWLERAIRYAVERARLREALEYEQHLLHLLMNNMPDGIFFKDAEGAYLRVNHAFARWCGLSDPQQAVGCRDSDLFPAEQAARIREDEQRVLATGQPVVGREEKIALPDGRECWVSTTRTPFQDANGRPIGIVGISRDITNLKMTQIALQTARDAAEAASHTKTRFLANMSHEVRTPLHAILGMTEMVLDSELSADQRTYLEMVYTAAESLQSVIDDILDFSRIDAGNLALSLTPFSLRQCLAGLFGFLNARAAAKGLKWTCRVDGQTPDSLIGDAQRLRQVLFNLIDNAIKFTDSGSVTVSVGYSQCSDDQVELTFTVADTGCGIARDKQVAIFEAFEQEDTSAARVHGGTGLGLTICASVVRMLDGKLTVESQPCQGSVFRVAIPFRLADADETESADEAIKDSRGDEQGVLDRPLEVLLAEDSHFNQQLAVGLLEKWGHRVTLAVDGREAIQWCQKKAFDLVLMDIQMPHLDGLAATRQIRRWEKAHGGHVPIIAMTAHALPEDRQRCLQAGMDEYLTKPLAARQLRAVLNRYCHLIVMSDKPQPDSTPPMTNGMISWEKALEVVEGRKELLVELIEIFCREYPHLLEEVRQAMDRGEAESLVMGAHRLKGCLRFFGDSEAGRLAARVEALARENNLDEAALACDRLTEVLGSFVEEVRRFAEQAKM